MSRRIKRISERLTGVHRVSLHRGKGQSLSLGLAKRRPPATRQTATRPAPRTQLSRLVTRPSHFDKAHPKPLGIAADEGRQARASARLKSLERGMMKGYWNSDQNPLNWKFAS